MKVFMNGGATVELSKAEILKRTKRLITDGRDHRIVPTVYIKKLSNGCEETYYSPKGLSGIGSNNTAKEIAEFIRKELGCRAWVYRGHDEISGDSCTVVVGPFARYDWRNPIPDRRVHRYSSKEILGK